MYVSVVCSIIVLILLAENRKVCAEIKMNIQLNKFLILIIVTLLLSNCGDGEIGPPIPDELYSKVYEELKQEDMILDANREISDIWMIGVKDNHKKRYGLAQYVCEVLKEKGLARDTTNVRIVDFFAVTRKINPLTYREASLGMVRCSDFQRLDP